jgi:hypothetical protein
MTTLKSFRGIPKDVVEELTESAFRRGRNTGAVLGGLGTGAVVGGGMGALGAGGAAAAYGYGKKRGERKGRFENQRSLYYAQQYARSRGHDRMEIANPEVEPSWQKSKNAFDKKMMAALIAGGQDIEKVAAAFEDELEKIANVWTNLVQRAGGLFQRGAQAYSKALPEGLMAAPGRVMSDVMSAPGAGWAAT